MYSVAFVPPELCHIHRYICYEERVWNCGIFTSRAMSSAQIHLLWRTWMHSVAFVPPELWHLQRYICYEERVCSMCHLHLQSYIICTDKSFMPNVHALCGICTSRAISSAQILYFCYEERMPSLPSYRCVICTEHMHSNDTEFMFYTRHLYLQSFVICTVQNISVMLVWILDIYYS